ncbi:MAG: UDP-N-acetylglucosamine--LPS N-acetylglucosamine transferase [Planctomycetota bacterium]|nr:UDP-N-acetylglucosamine--LPS N-acetylglucosamine transferase [Planctomycetota bacterium]
MTRKKKRILAVASGGGHFIELLRLSPAWSSCETHYLTSLPGHADSIASEARLHIVRDASRWNKAGVILMAIRIFWLLLRLHPRVIISTGAAPGYFALRFGKLFGGKTIWVDSMAAEDSFSLAGSLAKRYADLHLTPWPDLAVAGSRRYEGSVLG